MVKRDKDDPNYNDSAASQNVFQIVQVPEDESLTQEQIDKKNSILNQFSQKELGKYDIEKAKKKNMLKELQDQQLYPEEFKDQLQGKDLWIHHLHQQKLDKLREEMENDEEFNDNLNQYDDIEIEEEEYELEDNDEDFEDIDEEDDDDDNADFEIQNDKKKSQNKKVFQDDGDWEDLNQSKKNTKQQIQIKNSQKQVNLIYKDEESKEEYKRDKDSDEGLDEEARERKKIAKQLEQTEQELKKNYKLNAQQLKLLENDEFPDYNKLQFSETIKMKKFNEFGLPADDGYDYSQHVIKNNSEGDVVSIFNAVYTQPPKLELNLDYKPEEMTSEQKEVFESLNFLNKDDAYEELEDDFIMMAQEGEECIKDNKMLIDQQENNKNDDIKKIKKVVRFYDQEIEEKQQKQKNTSLKNQKNQKQLEKQNIQKKGKKNIESQDSSSEDEPKQQQIQINNIFQKQNLFNQIEKNDQQLFQKSNKINDKNKGLNQKNNGEDEEFNENEDNLEDEEIDEAQILQAMLEFEACEQATHKLNLDQNNQSGVTISKDLFNNILNEHLEEMKERSQGNINNNSSTLEIKKAKTTMKNVDKILEIEKKILSKESNQRHQKKHVKDLEDQKKEEKEENEANEKVEIESKAKQLKSNYQKLLENVQGKYVSKYDQQMGFYKKYAEYFKEKYGETFVPPTKYEETPLEKDYVLQKVIEQGDSSGEDVANMENTFENRIEQFEETIATKEFNTSTVHLNLNIVKEEYKKNHKQSIDIKSQQQLDMEENQKTYEQKQFKLFETLTKIQPRNKNETKEEKQERKKLLKEFKILRKEKNKEFKEGFNKMKSEKVAKVNNQTNSQALRGVSVYQI